MSLKSIVAGSAAAITLAVGLTGLATPASAAVVATLEGAKTDNYKACWNAPGTPAEKRSYLSLLSITVGGVVFRHSMTLPNLKSIDYRSGVEGIALRGSDNSSAWLTATSNSTNISFNSLRFDRNGQFGPMVEMKDRAALKTASITETLTVSRTKGGTVLGTAVPTYKYDSVAAAAPQGNCDTNLYSREYNGPAGRWHNAGVATYFDWDSTKAYPAKVTTTTTTPTTTAPDTTAPVLQSNTVPATTTTRTITIGLVASDNVRVAEVRFANEDGIWSAWQTFATSKQWTLSSSAAAYKGVSTQVRDAARNESNVIYKRVTCNLPCS